MQINKINSINSFKGLWASEPQEMAGVTKEGNKSIFIQETVYHPFKDEPVSQIEEEMEKARENNIKYVFDRNRVCVLNHLILVPSLGKPLDITQSEYDKIQKMTPKPGFEATPSALINDDKLPPEEVIKISEEL